MWGSHERNTGCRPDRRDWRSTLPIPWIAVLGLGLALTDAGAADHPTLVKLDSSGCVICHDDLVENRAVVHSPVADDCSTCHEMEKTPEGTTVSMLEEEPALCLICHDDLADAASGDLEAPHYPVTESCVSCHDPHASDNPRMLQAPLTELCATCHDKEELNEPHGGQLTEATDCTQCHRPHGSASERMLAGSNQHAPFTDGSCKGCHRAPFGTRIRLRARGEKLCVACHGDVTEGAGEHGSVHAAVKGVRGRAGCLNCHDPHMSDNPTMLRSAGPETCVPCHEQVVEFATADTGHEPAADDCLTCHLPHASEERSLLAAPGGELCRMCHDVDDEELVASHLGAEMDSLDCLSCHTPHGSGHERLLAANLHAPVLDGCDTCHEGSSSELMEDGESSLCLVCHDDIGELAEQAAVPHGALEMARCADCHNPHASAQPQLVREPGGGVCETCHDDIAPGEDEVAHGVIDLLGCQACHEPHGGENEKILRATGDALCLACHDPRAAQRSEDGTELVLLDRFTVDQVWAETVATLRLSEDLAFGHPMREHRVSGKPTKSELKRTDTTFEGELSCDTCHDPHKGRSEKILRWGAETGAQACMQCHPK